MSWSVRTSSACVLLVVVGALALVACGDDKGAEDEETATSAVDTSWFEVAAVTGVHEAPCTPGATPSQDGSECYDLDDALFDAAGVEEATAVEDQAPICEPAPGEVVCVETGMSPTTTQPSPGTWSVQFTLTEASLEAFNGLAEACTQRAPACPTGQVGTVLDDEVVFAPAIVATGFERDAFYLAGGFDQATAESIAARLSA